jgi:6-phosphogluconolactonase (cycloisomerase 2 family)
MFSMFAVLLPLILSSCGEDSDWLTMYVGTYSDGFGAYLLNQRTGKAGNTPFAKAPMPNPSYLALDGDRVYAVSEMPDSTAKVYAWHLYTRIFENLGSQLTGMPSGGEDPCYVAVGDGLLAVANYSGGTLALYRLLPGGGIAPLDSLLHSGTGGPDLSRQAEPHVHCAVFTPDGKHLLFSEFSADRIGIVDIDGQDVSGYRCAAQLHPDYGPRHLLFDASGRHLYVIGELSGDVTVFDYDDGRLTEKQTVRADRVDARGAADIHLSPDGKFLYASLRLQNDGIAVFKVADDGTLTDAGYQNTGRHPRNFNITPNGRFVFVACRDEDAIEIYRRNARTGLLDDTKRRILTEKPVFVGWVPNKYTVH